MRQPNSKKGIRKNTRAESRRAKQKIREFVRVDDIPSYGDSASGTITYLKEGDDCFISFRWPVASRLFGWWITAPFLFGFLCLTFQLALIYLAHNGVPPNGESLSEQWIIWGFFLLLASSFVYGLIDVLAPNTILYLNREKRLYWIRSPLFSRSVSHDDLIKLEWRLYPWNYWSETGARARGLNFGIEYHLVVQGLVWEKRIWLGHVYHPDPDKLFFQEQMRLGEILTEYLGTSLQERPYPHFPVPDLFRISEESTENNGASEE